MKKGLLALGLAGLMILSMGLGKDALATSSSVGSNSSNASLEKKVLKGTVKYSIDMSKYEKGKKVSLWVPVGTTIDDQEVGEPEYTVKADKVEVNVDSKGNKMIYIEWGESVEPSDRKAEISFHGIRYEGIKPELKEEGTIGDDMKEYLTPSIMVKTDGEIKKLADEITAGKTTVLEKTRAIYDWIIENMHRDESVLGCGTGDVEVLLQTKGGKCTDINSVFVGLCRAAGIPAREMFGIRMNADNITKNQHCWAQFYLPGTGWVYADPADVLKAVLKNNWAKDSKETKELQEYFFGNVDEKRIELSRGRDLDLNPKQNGGPLNNFGYPYAEVDGQAINSWFPDEFIYTISFTTSN